MSTKSIDMQIKFVSLDNETTVRILFIPCGYLNFHTRFEEIKAYFREVAALVFNSGVNRTVIDENSVVDINFHHGTAIVRSH